MKAKEEEPYIEPYCKVNITLVDMQALVRIKNYFGENDKTQLEHLAYDVLNRVTKGFNDLKL